MAVCVALLITFEYMKDYNIELLVIGSELEKDKKKPIRSPKQQDYRLSAILVAIII